MNEQIAKCLLCERERDLIDAHIIPKWAFKFLYPEETIGGDSLLLIGKQRPVRRRIGLYDGKILCNECDGFLGFYDDYAKKILLEEKSLHHTDVSEVIKNVDIEKIRIFLISVIWRASISNLEEFNRVKIGIYEKRLQELLARIQSKQSMDSLVNYSYIVTRFRKGELSSGIVNKNIMLPHTQKVEGINVAVLYMPNALKIFLKLDKRKFPQNLNSVSNYHKEGLLVIDAKNYAESDEFKALLEVV